MFCNKGESCSCIDLDDIVFSPEKIMAKLVLVLTIVDILTVSFLEEKYIMIGVVSTILISGIFFLVKKHYEYEYKSLPVFIMSEIVLVKSFILYGHISVSYYGNTWIRTIFFIAIAAVIIIGIFVLHSFEEYTREDFEEEERLKELAGQRH